MLKEKLKHGFRVFFSVLREDTKSLRRSPAWQVIRENYIVLNPSCAACGSSEKLQVHHIVPVHIDPSRELDSTNLITLCMGPDECHLNIGHNGSWKKHNPHVKEIAQALMRFRNDP